MTLKRIKGFTLIELLIVITIIGILAVAFLPSLLNAPTKARDTARLANVQSVQQAIAYGQLNGDVVPATTGCLSSAGLSTTMLANLGGKVPMDPNKSAPPQVKSGNCAVTSLGEYVYVKDPNNGGTIPSGTYSFGLYAKMEQKTSGNANCTELNVDNTDNTTTGDKDCYAVLVQ